MRMMAFMTQGRRVIVARRDRKTRCAEYDTISSVIEQ